jgi:hypothetical protein
MAGLFLSNRLNDMIDFLPKFSWHIPYLAYPPMFFASLGLMLLVLVAGIVLGQQYNGRMVIQIRKNWGVLFVMLLLFIPIPFLYPAKQLSSATLLLVPIAAFAANLFFYPRRTFFPLLLFWLFITAIILNHWVFV